MSLATPHMIGLTRFKKRKFIKISRGSASSSMRRMFRISSSPGAFRILQVGTTRADRNSLSENGGSGECGFVRKTSTSDSTYDCHELSKELEAGAAFTKDLMAASGS